MPRQAREKSSTGIYHIMVRGVNRQTIFEEDEDYEKFLNVIKQTKEKSGFKLYGYCLMGNHVHLLLREGMEALSLTMQRICSSFVYWYNWKYDRLGHLFQERYKSEVVEDQAYLLTALRYIHQNPIKGGITNSIEGYKWSSHHEYMCSNYVVDTGFILESFSTENVVAIKEFNKFMKGFNDDICLDYEERHRIADEEIIKLLEEKYKVKKGSLHLLKREDKDKILKNLKGINGVTIRQLVRVTGVSKYMVEKA